MDNLLDKYREVWSPLIEPDDYKYTMAELAPEKMKISDGTTVERFEFFVFNTLGKKICCSIYKHETGNRPLVIYSHSHSGNKAEGAWLLEPLAEHFSLLVFDYTGYGYSDKEPCTLGSKEQSDLQSVVNYAKDSFNFPRIYIWGRSMGAVATLLLAYSSPNICQGLVLDSPFSSTKEMVRGFF